MKDPAFLFYSSDFLTGTVFMTNEQIGMYVKLLCLQHQKGRLNEKHMLTICGGYDEDVFEKFTKDENGLYFNQRLEDEIKKRAKYTQSRRDNAKGKKKPKETKKAYAKHMPKHMENEDENINENINKDKNENRKIEFPFDSEKFKKYWNEWKEYKAKEHKFKYKSIQSEQAALMKLGNMSNNEDSAIAIIMQSMENGWKGFFELKEIKNGSTKDTVAEILREINS